MTVGIFSGSGLLMGIDAYFLYAILGEILVRLVLGSSEMVYWC